MLRPPSRRAPQIYPDDHCSGYAPGPAPHRILLIGDEAVSGRGVRTHQLALPGALARAVAARTSLGVDIEVHRVATPAVRAGALTLPTMPSTRFDAIVVVGQLPKKPNRGMRTLLRRATQATGRQAENTAAIIAAGPVQAPASGRLLREVVDAGAPFHLAPAQQTSRPAAQRHARAMYQQWGDQIAARLSPLLGEPSHWTAPFDLLNEQARDKDLTRLNSLPAGWAETFCPLTRLAAAAYGTRYAAISLVLREQTRFTACHGFTPTTADRRDTVCQTALLAHGGLAVPDATQDERFRSLGIVRDGLGSFYAGYRILGTTGQPVAVLCVFDPEPRSVLTQDITLLREFATIAQRQLHQLLTSVAA